MTTTLLGRDYLRVSRDKSGTLRSPRQQHADNLRVGAELGVELNGESYAEADAVSASRYGGKIRGEWARLLADLKSGAFGADVLVLWSPSRGSRDVGEWDDLLNACRDAGVRILVTTDERIYNPARPRDRKKLLNDAVDAEADSGEKSEAIQRASNAAAAAGEPWGAAPFGYRHEYAFAYDPERGKQRRYVSRVIEPAEADVVRELFARLRAGHSFVSIAADFAERGITGRRGRPLSNVTLRGMALRPAYAGLRLHTRDGDHYGDLTGAVEASWPAIVDAETFYAVRRMLTGRMQTGGTRAVHLVGMIARCAVCGGPMAANSLHGRLTYQCHKAGHVKIDHDDLDELAEAELIAFLSEPSVWKRLQPDRGPELAAARADTERARSELAELRAAAAARQLSVATVLQMEPALVAAVEDAERRERELSTPGELAGLIEPGGDIEAQWAAMPMSARRRVAKILLSPRGAGTMRVHPAGRRGGKGPAVPADERVTFDH